jgi:L-rhamnose mutarotase
VKVGLHTRLRPGAEAAYDAAHEAVWPELLEAIRAAGVREWLIFRDGLDLFHAIDCEDYDRAIATLAANPVNARWQAEMAPFFEALDGQRPDEGLLQLEEVFHLD